MPLEDGDTASRLVEAFIAWLDAFGERSFDPHDFWASRLGRKAKRLYYRRRIVGTVAALPFVVMDTLVPSSRRLVSSPRRYPIADANYAIGFFKWAEATGDDSARSRGEHYLAELERSRCPDFKEFCWGYPFHWESRVGTIKAETPLMTTIPYVYEAFEAGYRITGKPEYLRVMESIATFARQFIPVTELEEGGAAAAYTPFHRTLVVNASCYRGFLLAAAGKRFRQSEWTTEAERNIAFVLASQRPDGSWPYARMEGEAFVDNFHTCLVLKNLFKFWRIDGRPDVFDSLHRGYAFYRSHLLDEELQPIPFAVKPRLTVHRRDLYDYAEGINLAVLLLGIESDAEKVLHRLVTGLAADWALPDGHFVTRRLVIGRHIIPYHRWAQSQVLHALTSYCRSLS